jgi:hypothetical protein
MNKLYAILMILVFLLIWGLSSWAETLVAQVKDAEGITEMLMVK